MAQDEAWTIHNEPTRRPYGALVQLELGPTDLFKFDGQSSLLLPIPQNIQVEIGTDDPPTRPTQILKSSIVGFRSAANAEEAGLRLALALLWVGVSTGVPLRLRYSTPLPAKVYDRTSSSGIRLTAHATVYRAQTVQQFCDLVEQVFVSDVALDRRLLMSMELFAAARLEATSRSRFVGLVSSLEPLAVARSYGGGVETFVSDTLSRLASWPDIADQTRSSIAGRIDHLRRESIRQSILRLIREVLPEDDSAPKIVDEAYKVRSELLHEGIADVDLDSRAHLIEAIIRRLYARQLGLEPIVS